MHGAVEAGRAKPQANFDTPFDDAARLRFRASWLLSLGLSFDEGASRGLFLCGLMIACRLYQSV